MSEITRSEYWKECHSLADSIAAEALADNDNDRDAAEEDINDSRLHETIDGHQWIIYNAYNLDVIRHSENEDAFIDEFGAEDAGSVLKDRGLSGLHTAVAFLAMYNDVQGLLSDAMDAACEKLEEADSGDAE